MKKDLPSLIASMLCLMAGIFVASPVMALDGYYTIKNNGNQKYVNVAGRRTVTFVDESAIATAPGTVIKVKTNDKGQVEVLRSQGVDIPGYAEKAMNYVPKIVQLAVDKLHAEGSGQILGEHGLDAIMEKFNECFDYHLYVEQAGRGYRIYGKTPSMQPVVDFYTENKANVDEKLPKLEGFINSAIKKVLQKTGGSGASILVPFSIETVWQKMGGTASGLTKPVKGDNEAILKFYDEVLTSKENVWNFAYQTAMIYWGNVKSHPRFAEIKNKLGEYANYIDKVENIQPDSKYYIVQQNGKMDIVNEQNSIFNSDIAAEADFTVWTLAKRTDFQIAFNEENVLNGKYYTTLYTDFAYTLPDGVIAYKVTEVNEKTGVAKKVELESVPAQTPVLLESTSAEAQTLTLSTEDGTAPTDNILRGPDYLIDIYGIKTAQVEGLFDFAKDLLGEEAYNNYIKEYEHLAARNSGTVNNKYFFGLTEEDVELCVYGDDQDCVVRNLSTGNEKLGFYDNWTVSANQAFLVSEEFPVVKLFLKGDINRDGQITVADVTALVNIILGKATPENDSDKYDFDAAYVNDDEIISIADVTALVNIILGK